MPKSIRAAPAVTPGGWVGQHVRRFRHRQTGRVPHLRSAKHPAAQPGRVHRSYPFEYCRQPLPAADAHGLQTVASLAPRYFTQQGWSGSEHRWPQWGATGNAGAIWVEAVVVGGHRQTRSSASTCAAKASLSAMTPMSSRPTPTRRGSGAGVDGSETHQLGRYARNRPANQPGQRGQADRPGALGGGDDARGPVVLAPGIAGSDHAVRVGRTRIGRSAGSVSKPVSARVCSSARTRSAAPALRGIATGTISSSKVALHYAATARRCDCTAQASCSARLILNSARRFSAVSIIPPGNRVQPAAGCHSRRREPVGQGAGVRTDAPANVHGIELGLACALRATRQHEVAATGLDLEDALGDGLQAGTRSAGRSADRER